MTDEPHAIVDLEAVMTAVVLDLTAEAAEDDKLVALADRPETVIAMACCRDASRIPGCHCQGRIGRCHAPRLWATRARAIYLLLKKRGFIA